MKLSCKYINSGLFFIKIIIKVLFVLLIMIMPGFAETSKTEDIKKQMLELGLENFIFFEHSPQNYIITYENRSFIHEIHLLGSLLAGLKGNIENDANLEIYPQSRGQKILGIKFNFGDYLSFIDKKLTQEEFAKKIEFTYNTNNILHEKVDNSLFLHSDLVMGFDVGGSQEYGTTLLFLPVLQTYFGKGFSLSAMYRVPVFSQLFWFDFSKNNVIIPNNILNIYADYAVPVADLPLYTTFRAGTYLKSTYHNLLLGNETRYMFLDGKLNLNFSGNLIYDLKYKNIDFSILPFAQFYAGNLDITFEAGVGKRFNNEYIGWIRFLRQFKRNDISFTIGRLISNQGNSWGLKFEINMSIGPEHYFNPSYFRVTHQTKLIYMYGYGIIYWNPALVFSVENFIKRLYPEYIRTHLYFWQKD